MLSKIKSQKGFRKWRESKKTVPIPFRHFTPKAKKGIIRVMKVFPDGDAVYHLIAYGSNRYYDPDDDKSITFKEAHHSKVWRQYIVISEFFG